MKKLAFLLLLIATVSFSQNFQEIHHRAKINYSSMEDLSRLSALGIPIEHGTHKKGFYIISDFSRTELSVARNAGFTVDVLIEDVAAYFLQRNANTEAPQKNPGCEGNGTIDYTTPANFELGSMGGYLTYQELLDELDAMKALYPNLITAKANISTFLTEGQPDASTTPSIGGNGIKWVKISDNPDSTSEGEPQILYTAIHHAREPASLSQLVFFMWYLLENYNSDPEIQSILNNTELYFVPVINPDGYLYNEKTNPNGGGLWRKNRKNSTGTDLNRNYDYYINGNPNNGIWGGEGASSNPNSETYHGPSPFSEVETQAMKWFVENHDFVMAFNNHTSGDLLLYPYGYTANAPTPEDALFKGISEELVSQNGFNNILSSELYPASGDSDDFMYGTVGTHDKIYAFTPEIGPEFWPPSNQIVSISKGMMYHNITAAKMVNNFATVKDTAPLFTGSNVSVDADFSIKRLGVAGSGSFTVRLNPISANIIANSSPVSFNSLDVLQQETGSIQFTLAGSTQPGDVVVYELIVNNGSFDSTRTVTRIAGNTAVVFQDPGDSVTENFTNNGWGTTSSTFVSPSSSITDSPSGNYSANANKTISLSSPIDLTTAIGANVTFYATWEIENDYDYVQFEVSTNNSNSWIPQCGKFTNPGSTNNAQPTGEPLYDGNQPEWVLEEINLSDYLGETILVRFQFRSDNGLQQDGFYFDDLTINILEEGVLGTNDLSKDTFSVYPNPVNEEFTIGTTASDYAVEIYTLQGQLVMRSHHLSGLQTIDSGSFASGLYLLKITSETATQTVKILKE
ncbi:M14 family zinc carboxypeptidase [Altibacter lentus]|uniref:M14 family zinc carboxypeptidase n=1 Tax=Altibacter lentus TaxID=1223410 RepID=UPI000554C47C|nr:M14 family zinc carboxypeptidase [Altibacter lentus]